MVVDIEGEGDSATFTFKSEPKAAPPDLPDHPDLPPVETVDSGDPGDTAAAASAGDD